MPVIDDNGWKQIIKSQGEEIKAIHKSIDNLAKELYFFKGRVLGWSMAASGAIGTAVAILSKVL